MIKFQLTCNLESESLHKLIYIFYTWMDVNTLKRTNIYSFFLPSSYIIFL